MDEDACVLRRSGRRFPFRQAYSNERDVIDFVTCESARADRRVEDALAAMLDTKIDGYSTRLDAIENSVSGLDATVASVKQTANASIKALRDELATLDAHLTPPNTSELRCSHVGTDDGFLCTDEDTWETLNVGDTREVVDATLSRSRCGTSEGVQVCGANAFERAAAVATAVSSRSHTEMVIRANTLNARIDKNTKLIDVLKRTVAKS